MAYYFDQNHHLKYYININKTWKLFKGHQTNPVEVDRKEIHLVVEVDRMQIHLVVDFRLMNHKDFGLDSLYYLENEILGTV